MNEDQFEDLKRFIDSRISQSESRFDQNLNTLMDDMNRRFDEVQAATAEAISAANDGNDEQLKDHEQRIVRLEHQAA